MKYRIEGGNLPVVEVLLEPNESIKCEGGAMSWMTSNMKMETSGGGLGKMFSKMISGEKLFQNTYTAVGAPGEIAFASSFPGSIIAVEIEPGREIICQKSAYLAASEGVELSVFFQKKLGSGFFGGEGFIMQRLSGRGIAFLEIDGSVVEKNLLPGERLIVDTGYVSMIDGSCSIEIESVKGVKNVLVGGEGLFNTVVTGPGRVVLQTMPISKTVGVIKRYMPSND